MPSPHYENSISRIKIFANDFFLEMPEKMCYTLFIIKKEVSAVLLGGRKKILLVRLINRNYGDTVIADNTAFLIKKALSSRAVILDYDLRSRDVFQVKYCDAVIFAGGGLIKFKGEDFEQYISEIIASAEEFDVPVFFNAVGVEGFDEENTACMALKKAINSPCVKGISVRDDTETLINSYILSNIRVRSVVDSAVWSDKTYRGIRPEKNRAVGIGIARELLFSDYGHTEIDGQYLISYWCVLIKQLEDMGYKWKIFTNGLNSDEEFAEKVLSEIGHGEKVAQPMSSQELIESIASFDSIIAQRMHSCIIAYSLGIPAVGLVWNEKMRFWGDRIGCSHRFVVPEQLNVQKTMEAFDRSLNDNITKPDRALKRGVYKELRHFLRIAGKNAEHIENINDYKRKIAAAALGGIGKKFKNTNTLDAFRESLDAGFCLFEVDVRAASDGKAVCINGWNKDSYGKLGIDYDDELKNGLSSEDFERCLYYKRYKAVSFDEFAEVFSKNSLDNDIRLIIDIGKPPKDRAEMLIGSVAGSIRTHNIPADRIMIRTQRESDIELIEKTELCCSIAYYLAVGKDKDDSEKNFKSALNCCKRHGIKVISMMPETFSAETAELCRKNKLKPLVLSYTKAGDIFNAFENGAEYVGSHYISPNYMLDLLT